MHELDQNLQILASILPRMRMIKKIVKNEADARDWRKYNWNFLFRVLGGAWSEFSHP
jgi:hypothetical protein